MSEIPRLQGPTLANVSFTAVPVKFVDQQRELTTHCLEAESDGWYVYGNDEALVFFDHKEELQEMFEALERASRYAASHADGISPYGPVEMKADLGAPEGDRSGVVIIDRQRSRK